jgi:Ulp1 family protease
MSKNNESCYFMYLQRQHYDSRFYIFNCFFYSKLVQCKEQNVDFATLQKWNHGVNLFFIDYIMIPINHNNHWNAIFEHVCRRFGFKKLLQTTKTHTIFKILINSREFKATHIKKLNKHFCIMEANPL